MKKFYPLIALVCSIHFAQAQDWLGLHSSNYAGVQGVSFQPASIVDSRYKFQISLIAVSATVANTYYSVPNADVKRFDIDSKRFIKSTKGGDKGGYLTSDSYVPFSFMLTLSPKHALALTIRERNFINFDGLDTHTANLLDKISDAGEFVIDPQDSFDGKKIYAQAHAWSEYGLTYGRVIFDHGTTFLKGGGTVKLLDGIASGYAFVNDINFKGLANDRVDVGNINIESGFSKNLTFDNNFDYKPFQNLGMGLDLGVVYEFRPDIEDYKYSMDGEDNLTRRDKNKYKYRIGFSILDIGAVTYDKSMKSGNISGNASDVDVNNLEGDADQIIDDLFTYQRGGSYKMSLPTRLVGDFDYHVSGGFFLNFTSQVALRGGSSNKEKTKYATTLSLTPRLENKTFGVALPISYDRFARLNSGVSLRLGNFIVGSRDAINNFVLGKDAKSFDVQFAVRFGMPFSKKRDKDNDGVSNKKDNCKSVPGVWAFKGCPDTDGDGVQDSEDECITTAGSANLKGCPDTDGDGIKDMEDACPTLAGLPQFKGCPDTDGDGIQDSEDKCPEVAGTIAFQGCPDTDGDGVVDSEDLCPTLPGSLAKKGCPDSDNDGLYDNEDKCPDAPGPLENNGCPYADTDGDGVIDSEDACVLIIGVPENNGCPEIKQEEQEILNTAFNNLEFESGKDKIALSSYTSLVELANLLKLKPDWKLQIIGFTDSVGKRESNITLSKNRAMAVAKFLTAQGVDKDRFSVDGKGPDNPVADNATAAGRKQNRRVELKVIF